MKLNWLNPPKLVVVTFEGAGNQEVGFVIGESSVFLLLNRLTNDFLIDGFVILRKDLIKSFNRLEDTNVFMKAAWLLELKPSTRLAVKLDSWRSVIETAHKAYGAIVFYEIATNPGSCLVGVPTNICTDSVTMNLIDCDGSLEEAETNLTFNKVSKVQFGGMYESTLFRLALLGNEADSTRE